MGSIEQNLDPTGKNIESSKALDTALARYLEASNQFANSQLIFDLSEVSPDIVITVINAVLDSYDSLRDPDFNCADHLIEKVQTVQDKSKLFISLTDLGVVGDLYIERLSEDQPVSIIVVPMITSLSCAFKSTIVEGLREKILQILGDKIGNFDLIIEDQFVDFIRRFMPEIGYSEVEVEQKVSDYLDSPSTESYRIIQALVDEAAQFAQNSFTKDSKEQLNFLDALEFQLQARFPTGGWINPAWIPAKSIPKFEFFMDTLDKFYPSNGESPHLRLAFKGAETRADPIANLSRPYRQECSKGSFAGIALPIGSLAHAKSTNTWLKNMAKTKK